MDEKVAQLAGDLLRLHGVAGAQLQVLLDELEVAGVRFRVGGCLDAEGEEDRAELLDRLGRARMARDLHAEDRQAISEVLFLHGHLFDGGQLGRLEEIFTPEVVYDLSDVGVGTFDGIEAVRSAALRLGAGNPVAHHVTNVVITSEEDDRVTARSKGLMIMANGTLASVTHLDTLRRHDGGWRISRRVVLAQRTPRGGAHLVHAGDQ